MNQNKPLLSVAIPTKNRQYYCIEVIKHILSYDNENFELIIQDNSDDRVIEQFISTVEDRRLKYVYTDEQISSVENMSRSIKMTKGEYVCMIGDDDSILPTIFEYVKYMKENDIDSISPGYIPEYFWPNNETGNSGTLKIIKTRFISEYQQIEPIKRLEKLFENGIVNYSSYNLPRVYHGLIKKEVLDKIYNKIGAYFAGLSPDIYSTVALSSLVKKHFLVKGTFTIAGVCPQSTTSQSRLGGHKGELKDAPHFKNNDSYKWDNLIPEYYSVETIWAETAVTAAKDFKLLTILDSFNKIKFNCIAYQKNRSIKNIVIKKIFNKGESFYRKLVFVMISYIYIFPFYLWKVIRVLFFQSKEIYKDIGHINNISKYVE